MASGRLEAPPRPGGAAPGPSGDGGPPIAELVRGRVWWIVAGATLLISLLLVVWARTRPGFDPYGWLTWGRQTLSWALDTNAAPSWKPLPYLFTLPYAVFGHYQVWLWMITAAAISLAGVVFAGRIAYRLVGGFGAGSASASTVPRARAAAWVAAVFAGAGVLAIQSYSHYILSAQSDPVIVALCLGAVDCHLSGRPRWSFALWLLASLGRPEAWPFLGLYAIWAWRAVPQMRRFVAAGLALLVALWFGIPAITSRSPFIAGTNALGSGRAPHGNKVLDTISRFLHLQPAPLLIVAALSVAWAVWRRDRLTLALAGGVVLWVVVEIAFALHGWPALPRYMFEAGAAVAVVAAVAVGRALSDGPSPTGAGLWRVLGVVFVIAVCVSLVPFAASRTRAERKDLRVQRARTVSINRLAHTVAAAGGAARIRRCGEPLTLLEYQSVLAWTLHVNVARVGWKFPRAIRSGRPIVLFIPTRRNGWLVRPVHQRSAACRRL